MCNTAFLTLVGERSAHKETQGYVYFFIRCSGGVARHWAGVPRQLFSPGSSGVRCVCVEDPIAAEEDPNLQKYDGCPAHAESCSVGAH